VKSLERKIAFVFGTAVFVLLLVTVVAAWNAERFRGSYVWVKETYEIFVRLDQVITDLLGMEASTRGFQLTGDETTLRPYQSGATRIDGALRELRRLLSSNPQQLARVDELAPLAARAKELMAARIAERRARGTDLVAPSSGFREGQRILADFWRVAREIAVEERRTLDERLRSAYVAGRFTIFTAIGTSVLAVGFVAIARRRVKSDLARRREVETALQESFARVESLYNQAPCGYHSLDEKGVFIAINDTALRWLGYSRDEVVGKMHFTQVLTPESAELFPARFDEFRRLGAVQNVEYEWRRKDGTTLIVLLNATAIYDPHGHYVSSRATVFDVTQLKRTEAERDRFFTLSRDLLCTTNFDGYFTRLNPAWERVLGFTCEELMARPFIEFVHPDDREQTLAEAERVMAGRGTDFENRYRCKDGSYRWLRWSAHAVVAERLIYASARDSTERRAAEEHIHQLNTDLALRAHQLEAANRELESFSYSVSHDLRAPLRHINGFASLLTKHAETSLDEESRRYVGVISKAAKQMGALIDDLLAFSRIGRVPLRHERVNHNQLVAAVIADGRYEANGRAIAWEINPLPDVRADPAMLRQVWANLIDNAVKYSGKNPQPRVAIAGREDAAAGEFVFSVRDNGVGFDMAYADKLFGVFQRLHGPSDFEGTGIGLANVRRIVTRHGGRTWAEGRVGKGAVFYFSLPTNLSRPDSSG
jgi:PAS domain S-box-containing protein